jgi:hypothetical protein
LFEASLGPSPSTPSSAFTLGSLWLLFRSGDAMSENVIQFPYAIAPAAPALLKNEVGRFALMTKSRGRSPCTRSRHRCLQEAEEGLAALTRGNIPRGLDWAAIYDMSKSSPADPTAPAILLCVFHRESASAKTGKRRVLWCGGQLRGAAPFLRPRPAPGGVRDYA